MKIGSQLQFEVPDTCVQVGCQYWFKNADQGCLCSRCPVFNCGKVTEKDTALPLLEPNRYRDDWAAEWEEFFKTGKEPVLHLKKPSINESK